MKPLFVLSLLAVLAGCAPLTIYHREGVAVTRMQTDQTNCEVSALRDVPEARQVRRGPPRYIPGPRYCDRLGNCRYGPGYYIPGEIYTVDTNAGLRGRVADQCMAQKGYAPVTLPQCTNAVAQSVPRGATRVLPKLTSSSCVIRNQGGSWQIVSQVQ
jgi:hypothetical protein